MRVWQIGNFGPAHSTENELCKAMRIRGWQVRTMQENQPDSWEGWRFDGPDRPDFILWTRTWRGNDDQQRGCLASAREAAVPTVGYHLDRWWGLARQTEITGDRWPFFDVDLMFTADGAHQRLWADHGIDHVWAPPAVSSLECEPGTVSPKWASTVAFVGSWGGYHPEWPHRMQLAQKVEQAGGRLWPQRGRPAVRSHDLRDLYASVSVAVGDSCLVPTVAGDPMSRYCSDRVPETLGRGATSPAAPKLPAAADSGSSPNTPTPAAWGK